MGPPGSDIYPPQNRSIYPLYIRKGISRSLCHIQRMFPDISPRLSKVSRRLASIFSGISGGILVLACLLCTPVKSVLGKRLTGSFAR